MRILTAAEVAEMSARTPAAAAALDAQWVEGPFAAERLDAGIVVMSPGGATPAHSHIGGQVFVVTAGRGFVEAGGERRELGPGDIVVAPPGEVHVHGALADSSFAHLTVTTLGYTFPEPLG